MAQMFTKGFRPKSTTLEAKKLIRDEIKDFYGDEPYNRTYGNDFLMNMKEDAENAVGNYEKNYSDWYKGANLVQIGNFRIYYSDQADFLKKIYGKSVENWDGDKIHNTYKNLIGREYDHMLRERKNKGR